MTPERVRPCMTYAELSKESDEAMRFNQSYSLERAYRSGFAEAWRRLGGQLRDDCRPTPPPADYDYEVDGPIGGWNQPIEPPSRALLPCEHVDLLRAWFRAQGTVLAAETWSGRLSVGRVEYEALQDEIEKLRRATPPAAPLDDDRLEHIKYLLRDGYNVACLGADAKPGLVLDALRAARGRIDDAMKEIWHMERATPPAAPPNQSSGTTPQGGQRDTDRDDASTLRVRPSTGAATGSESAVLRTGADGGEGGDERPRDDDGAAQAAGGEGLLRASGEGGDGNNRVTKGGGREATPPAALEGLHKLWERAAAQHDNEDAAHAFKVCAADLRRTLAGIPE
jgi:hypothetical protein